MSCRLRVGCYGHEELLGLTHAGERLANSAMLSRWYSRVQRTLKFIPQFIQVGSISLSPSRMARSELSPWNTRGKLRMTLVCNVLFGHFEHAQDARAWNIVTSTMCMATNLIPRGVCTISRCSFFNAMTPLNRQGLA
jgi:hypothetical protein